jgi:uncharacterized repeat protein (TIGR03837 family)
MPGRRRLIMSRAHSWDIFCRVVDNFGDAGVSWRLARQLAEEHGGTVRFWIDDLAPLHLLCREVRPDAASQFVAGIEVQRWTVPWTPVRPCEVVIEAFGCGLPEEYARAMAEDARRPLWIVLEYLSAEDWVPAHHGLPSPHPRWPIPRYFFFPGFGAGSGGVLREAGLADRRHAFGATEQRRMWKSLGFEPPDADATVVSMFTYESAPLTALLAQWERHNEPVVIAIPQGKIVAVAAAYFGVTAIETGKQFRRGRLEVRVLPFVEQARYDELLWSCHCDFVRGEDSFVRAQWAAVPMVWQLYPQADNAHSKKLDAFLDVYCADLPRPAATALRAMWQAWNAVGDNTVSIGAAWHEFWAYRAMLEDHARTWATRLAADDDLASRLAQFCAERVKY